MNFKMLTGLALSLVVSLSVQGADVSYTRYVDPFIGTATVGHTYPGATLPFAMVQVGPDTGSQGWAYCAGYHDTDNSILGFSHTHLSGTGCPDMGDILLMPVVGEPQFEAGPQDQPELGYRSRFDHATEVARPGYYAVTLDEPQVRAEMTLTPRVGMHRYTYLNGTDGGVIVDLGHGMGDAATQTELRVIDDQTVVGVRRSSGFVQDHQYYFVLRTSQPIVKVVSWQDGTTGESREVSGKVCKLYLQFAVKPTKPLCLKVALSTASVEGAQQNMAREMKTWNFDRVAREADQTWNRQLARFEIDPIDENQRVSFYTSLYHALLMPNLVTDVDGAYTGWDHQLHRSTQGDLYTNFSLWDTYRALHPLYTLIQPETNETFIRSLLQRFREVGALSTNEYGLCETYAMIGNHAIPVIVDAYLKGARGFDAQEAYQAIYDASTRSHVKSDWESYNQYGYYPFDKVKVESVSRTLESAYDDACVARMAEALGKSEDQQTFERRAMFYKNLLDPETRFMRARDTTGAWRTPFDPFFIAHELLGGDYTEGNSWQYTWHVQHDAPGLVALIGGKAAFAAKLDSLFFLKEALRGVAWTSDVTGLIGQYAHGNEPSHHVAYLYNYADQGYKTQRLVREIFDRFYMARRDGLCGNDDCGQMSAWYIFSAMGFYPVDPASGAYVLGAPQAHRIVMQLPEGKRFTMEAHNLSKENQYVKSVTLNGKPLSGFILRHEQVMQGGTLCFEMTDQPVK
ncbi:MAG: GH92 family glycosyl hydrolase [Alistipes sp.]|nr:GH92 family glycosyl hydrolase [Alistipes sp.]